MGNKVNMGNKVSDRLNRNIGMPTQSLKRDAA